MMKSIEWQFLTPTTSIFLRGTGGPRVESHTCRRYVSGGTETPPQYPGSGWGGGESQVFE